ncbi:putative metal-dependent hydrolase TatD [subsurface metagenome]
MLLDTHAHLADPVFDPDLIRVIERAKEAGVSAIIAVSENLKEARRNLKLAEKHPAILPAAGLYPGNLDMQQAQEMVSFIRRKRDRLVAIGEVGLDRWIVKEESDRELQQEIFCMFIDLSLELDLPLNIHSRSAGRHVIALLLGRGANKVQLHAFDGKSSTAQPAVEAGYFFSIPPSVVRSRQKQKLVRALPLSCLLVETDSPVLGPDPKERNEPANANVAVNAIAEIKGLSREEVLGALAANTRQLYGGMNQVL